VRVPRYPLASAAQCTAAQRLLKARQTHLSIHLERYGATVPL
jgi:hypothetical protein